MRRASRRMVPSASVWNTAMTTRSSCISVGGTTSTRRECLFLVLSTRVPVMTSPSSPRDRNRRPP
jgi:hypothetical protein